MFKLCLICLLSVATIHLSDQYMGYDDYEGGYDHPHHHHHGYGHHGYGYHGYPVHGEYPYPGSGPYSHPYHPYYPQNYDINWFDEITGLALFKNKSKSPDYEG